MGLLYQKKNNFYEEDGKTIQFTDCIKDITPAEGTDLEFAKAKETETPKEMEEKVNNGGKEQH